MSTLVARYCTLLPFSTKKNQESLEKWVFPDLGQGRYKVSLENFVQKSKEAVKDQWGHVKKF